MKFIWIGASCLLASTLWAQSNTPLKGTFVKGSKQKIYLGLSPDGRSIQYLDSTMIDGKGAFAFKTKLKQKDIYTLRHNNITTDVILDPNLTTTLVVEQEFNGPITFTGSLDNDLAQYYNAKAKGLQALSDSLSGIMKTNPGAQAELQTVWTARFTQDVTDVKATFDKNPSSLANIYAFQFLNPEVEKTSLKQINGALKRNHPYSVRVQTIGSEVQKLLGLTVGDDAPEIKLPTPEGKLMSSKEFLGQVVLIDFWASWCGPCRKSNPEVVALYHKYKNQGFDILSVSLDKTKDAWLKAIEQDGLVWKNHISDLKHWSSIATQIYSFNSIPTTYLVDKKGKIIGKNLHGNDLEQAVIKAIETK